LVKQNITKKTPPKVSLREKALSYLMILHYTYCFLFSMGTETVCEIEIVRLRLPACRRHGPANDMVCAIWLALDPYQIHSLHNKKFSLSTHPLSAKSGEGDRG
jgi:hypothetical protein